MKSRRLAGLFLAILIALALVAGCGSGDDSDQADPASTDQSAQTNEPTSSSTGEQANVPTTTPQTANVPTTTNEQLMLPVGAAIGDLLYKGDVVDVDSRYYYGPDNMAELPEADNETGVEDVVLSTKADYCTKESECAALDLYTGDDVELNCYEERSAAANYNREQFAGTDDPNARDTDKWIYVKVVEPGHPYEGAVGFVNGAWLRIDLRRLALDLCPV